jgi:type IV pilus assembly protein PilC
MPKYTWVGTTKQGARKRGEMDAEHTLFVEEKLKKEGIKILSVKEKTEPSWNIEVFKKAVTTKDVVIFSRQFATMINAGLPIVQALDILGTQNDHPEMKKIILQIKASVESGKTLSQAMDAYVKVFGKLFVNLVKAGEASGQLDRVLLRVAEYIEKNAKMIRKIKSAMTYPALVLVVAFVVTGILLVYAIPVFQKMFKEMGAELPALTQSVIRLSENAQAYKFEIVGVVLAIFLGVKFLLKTEKGSLAFDETVLYIPGVGTLIKKILVARFTRTMATMMSSGVGILDALSIVAEGAGNKVLEKGLVEVRSRISEGTSMASALGQVKVFPSMVVQMIAVGESTGTLDTMLGKIADFYDDEVETSIGVLMSSLEPIIMSFLAVVMGGLVISMYLPVFSMASAVGR